MSKATTTPLIRELFEEVFKEQIDDDKKGPKAPRRKRCNACENCLAQECGSCLHCKDMIKFGGSGKSKQACVKRNCLNADSIKVTESDNEDDGDEINAQMKVKKRVKTLDNASSDDESEDDEKENNGSNKKYDNLKGQLSIKDCFVPIKKLNLTNVDKDEEEIWPAPALGKFNKKVIYDQANIFGNLYKAGDYILSGGNVCQIIGFYEKDRKQRAHLKVFVTSDKTVLDETGDPHEIFEVMECSSVRISSIDVSFSIIS